MEAITDKPPDRDVNLCLPHQPAVMYNSKQEAGKHQADSHFGINAGAAIVGAVELQHFAAKPGQIKHTVNSRQNIIFRNKIPK